MHLWDWLLDLLDFINLVEHWRFAVTMLVAGAVAALCYWLMPTGGVRTFMVAASFCIGLIAGILWERSR